jgi:sialate O-acetylesterase
LGRAVPASLYDNLIKSHIGFPVRGVLWYQGEANTKTVEEALEYKLWLKSLISVYRSQWHEPKMPFVVIRLPQFNNAKPEAWSTLQQVQTQVTNEVPHTVLVNIDDLGDMNDIHPRKKREVGVRAAEVTLKLIRK